MALTKCKQCGRHYAQTAEVCPYCEGRGPKGGEAGGVLTAMIGTAAIAVAVLVLHDVGSTGSSACDDLACLSARHIDGAAWACTAPIERMAKYEHRWTGAISRAEFSHHQWASRHPQVIRYMGDRLQLQNGFGAWRNYVYECDYRLRDGAVVDARAWPGKL